MGLSAQALKPESSHDEISRWIKWNSKLSKCSNIDESRVIEVCALLGNSGLDWYANSFIERSGKAKVLKMNNEYGLLELEAFRLIPIRTLGISSIRVNF